MRMPHPRMLAPSPRRSCGAAASADGVLQFKNCQLGGFSGSQHAARLEVASKQACCCPHNHFEAGVCESGAGNCLAGSCADECYCCGNCEDEANLTNGCCDRNAGEDSLWREEDAEVAECEEPEAGVGGEEDDEANANSSRSRRTRTALAFRSVDSEGGCWRSVCSHDCCPDCGHPRLASDSEGGPNEDLEEEECLMGHVGGSGKEEPSASSLYTDPTRGRGRRVPFDKRSQLEREMRLLHRKQQALLERQQRMHEQRLLETETVSEQRQSRRRQERKPWNSDFQDLSLLKASPTDRLLRQVRSTSPHFAAAASEYRAKLALMERNLKPFVEDFQKRFGDPRREKLEMQRKQSWRVAAARSASMAARPRAASPREAGGNFSARPSMADNKLHSMDLQSDALSFKGRRESKANIACSSIPDVRGRGRRDLLEDSFFNLHHSSSGRTKGKCDAECLATPRTRHSRHSPRRRRSSVSSQRCRGSSRSRYRKGRRRSRRANGGRCSCCDFSSASSSASYSCRESDSDEERRSYSSAASSGRSSSGSSCCLRKGRTRKASRCKSPHRRCSRTRSRRRQCDCHSHCEEEPRKYKQSSSSVWREGVGGRIPAVASNFPLTHAPLCLNPSISIPPTFTAVSSLFPTQPTAQPSSASNLPFAQQQPSSAGLSVEQEMQLLEEIQRQLQMLDPAVSAVSSAVKESNAPHPQRDPKLHESLPSPEVPPLRSQPPPQVVLTVEASRGAKHESADFAAESTTSAKEERRGRQDAAVFVGKQPPRESLAKHGSGAERNKIEKQETATPPWEQPKKEESSENAGVGDLAARLQQQLSLLQQQEADLLRQEKELREEIERKREEALQKRRAKKEEGSASSVLKKQPWKSAPFQPLRK